MQPDYFAGAAALTTIKAPAAVTADGNTPGVDIRSALGKLCFLLTALNTAGTNPTLAAKLQHSADADLVGTVAYAGTGDGTLTEAQGGADAVEEDITITFSNATTAAVSGSVTGSLGNATVGTKFTSTVVEFLLTAGATAFESGDEFTVPLTARSYADVSGGAFTGLTTGANIQRLAVDGDKLGPFVRVNFDIGGTVSPAYTVGIGMLALQQNNP